LDGKTATTDNEGQAVIKSRVGHRTLAVTKKYYKDQNSKVLVAISKQKIPPQIKLEATGRQVPISVTNRVGGAVLANALIKAAGTEAQTDSNGNVSIVLPAEQTAVEATIEAAGFNPAKVSIIVTDQPVTENTFSLIPAGKIFFLSKKSGTLDVVKTDLDGSNRITVLSGTGKEEDYGTALLESRDWKYLVLKSKRDDKVKLYLIETDTGKTTTLDEGDEVNFSPVGWYGEQFIYTVERTKLKDWEPKKQSLKSFNAKTQKITILDEAAGEGTDSNNYTHETYTGVFIAGDRVVYGKYWQRSYYSSSINNGKKASINSVQPDGSNKKTLREFDADRPGGLRYIYSHSYKPQKIYFDVTDDTGNDRWYYEASPTAVKDAAISDNDLYRGYPSYVISPNSKSALWTEQRDGKSALILGDSQGDNGKAIAYLSEFSAYSWYSDNYLVVSKHSNELYLMPVAGVQNETDLLKISDYTQSNNYQYGY
jgi:hypothetical protein